VISDIQSAAFARTPKSRARWAPLAFITKSWNELTPEDGAVNAAISWSTSDGRVTVAVVISPPALVEGALSFTYSELSGPLPANMSDVAVS
jgi:hypothetical protein